MKDKGQLIGEWMIGLFGGIVAMSIIYIILYQAYDADLRPQGVEDGVDATNLSWIDIGWEMLLIPVGIAVFYGMVNSGRRRRLAGYE